MSDIDKLSKVFTEIGINLSWGIKDRSTKINGIVLEREFDQFISVLDDSGAKVVTFMFDRDDKYSGCFGVA